jgi:hypothetical protein
MVDSVDAYDREAGPLRVVTGEPDEALPVLALTSTVTEKQQAASAVGRVEARRRLTDE